MATPTRKEDAAFALTAKACPERAAAAGPRISMMFDVSVSDIDARSCELMDEFERHYEEVVACDPQTTDKAIVFQCWALQKIAGLQVIVFELAKHVKHLNES